MNIYMNMLGIFNFNPYFKETEDSFVIDVRLFDNIAQRSFSDKVRPLVIDFTKVYKWPTLKQTGYHIDLDFKTITVSSSGKAETFENAIKIEDIRINFDNGKKLLLLDYLNNKKFSLDIHLFALNLLSGKDHSEENKYTNLDSSDISQALSWGSQWKVKDKSYTLVGGNKNIFESDELLDQLAILLILLNSQVGFGNSIELIYSLLSSRINYWVEYSFKGLEVYHQEILSDCREFLVRVLKGDNKLPASYHFPLDGKFSFRFWFVGKSFSEKTNEQTKFFPQIASFLQGLRKNYSNKLGVTLDSISGKVDEKKTVKNFEQRAEIALLREKVKNISERDRNVVLALLDESCKTQQEIADQFKISKGRVSQILKKLAD